MSYSLTWLSSVLTAAGLKVVEVPGWQTRGVHGLDMQPQIKGIVCHHTAACLHQSPEGLVHTLITNRPPPNELTAPLAHLGLEEDGTYYVVAAGKANHAGSGQWHGEVNNGNTAFIGIEAANTGLGNDPWDPPQMAAYVRGCAAILKHIGAQASMCIGHKEWTPRKIDPAGIDMNVFRAEVGAILSKSVHLSTGVTHVNP